MKFLGLFVALPLQKRQFQILDFQKFIPLSQFQGHSKNFIPYNFLLKSTITPKKLITKFGEILHVLLNLEINFLIKHNIKYVNSDINRADLKITLTLDRTVQPNIFERLTLQIWKQLDREKNHSSITEISEEPTLPVFDYTDRIQYASLLSYMYNIR